MAAKHRPKKRPGKVTAADLVTEEQVQGVIVDGLRLSGYEVLITSRQRKAAYCAKCKRVALCSGCGGKVYAKGGDGVSEGVPDLIVTRAAWPIRMWLGMEVKGPKTEVSTEQQDLADRNRTVIVRSLDEALAAAKERDHFFRLLNPDYRTWLSLGEAITTRQSEARIAFLEAALVQATSHGIAPSLYERPSHWDRMSDEEREDLRYHYETFGADTVLFTHADESSYAHNCPELAAWLREREMKR